MNDCSRNCLETIRNVQKYSCKIDDAPRQNSNELYTVEKPNPSIFKMHFRLCCSWKATEHKAKGIYTLPSGIKDSVLFTAKHTHSIKHFNPQKLLKWGWHKPPLNFKTLICFLNGLLLSFKMTILLHIHSTLEAGSLDCFVLLFMHTYIMLFEVDINKSFLGHLK